MKHFILSALGFLGFMLTPPAHAACAFGAYRSAGGETLAISPITISGKAELRYTFLDGRRGIAGDGGPVACVEDQIRVANQAWERMPMRETDTRFQSHGTELFGRLMEPEGVTAPPLVVMVHGSERTSPLNTTTPLLLAAQGLSVFVYDKRGTARSEGEYTQNFELLADDAAAALAEARRLAAGRYRRAGYYGGSQGGWVAPLAATRSAADFVAVGFGLVLSPVDEDREQVVGDLRAAGFGDREIAASRQVTDATADVVRSHFTKGFDELERVRKKYGTAPWFSAVRGEFSGDLLRTPLADLRRIGRARYDNVELIWDYDAMPPLRALKVPQLWVLAGADREAPPEIPRARLGQLKHEGKPIDAFVFPDTDHGIVEFETMPDGSRRMTRYADGFFRLLGDWIKGEAKGPYGRAAALD